MQSLVFVLHRMHSRAIARLAELAFIMMAVHRLKSGITVFTRTAEVQLRSEIVLSIQMVRRLTE